MALLFLDLAAESRRFESEYRLVKLFQSVNLDLNRCLSILCFQVTIDESHTTHLISLWYYTLHLKENRHRAPLCGDLRFVLSHVLGTRESLRLKIRKM